MPLLRNGPGYTPSLASHNSCHDGNPAQMSAGKERHGPREDEQRETKSYVPKTMSHERSFTGCVLSRLLAFLPLRGCSAQGLCFRAHLLATASALAVVIVHGNVVQGKDALGCTDMVPNFDFCVCSIDPGEDFSCLVCSGSRRSASSANHYRGNALPLLLQCPLQCFKESFVSLQRFWEFHRFKPKCMGPTLP